jgi:lipopolysaccharide heptosyltransferase II
MTRKALIVKLGAIGDVACLLPAAWKLHQSGAEIHWLCGKTVAPLLSCYTWVRPIVVDDARLLGGQSIAAIGELLRIWRKLVGFSCDVCAVLQYDRKYRLLVLPVRARRSIHLDQNERSLKLVGERHHSAEFVRILSALPDEYRADEFAPVPPDQLPISPLPPSEKVRIALVPGGARNLLRDDPQRRWPLESYVALARTLIEKGFEVVLTGGSGDQWASEAFAGLTLRNCIAHWSLPQTLAFYKSCDCVVTHDTGPLHLAGLVQCGLVGLFGPTAPSKALPRRPGVVALWGGEKLACRPCYDGRTFAHCNANVCMTSITPQRVAATVDLILANRGADWKVESL